MPDSGPDGLAVVDKPAGWTSHDVVARSRKLLGTRKVGHAGTLDPSATGVLLLGVGKATRLLRYLSGAGKRYVGEVVLGATTTTLDADGDVLETFDMSGVTLREVRAVVQERFTGDIAQVPPMVSALKVDGRRLHELAREGIEVERKARPVRVDEFLVDEVPGAPGVFRVEVQCSSGTYVRSLAADLGEALGGGAHLRALRRTAVGSFTLADAVALDELDPGCLLAPAEAVRDMARIVADDGIAADVAHGKLLDRTRVGLRPGAEDGADEGPWAVVDVPGQLLAVYEPHRSGAIKPSVVLAASGAR